MRWLFRFHLAQIGMALSAAAFVFTNAALLGRWLHPSIYAAAFFGTWAIYLWDARDSFSAEDQINQPLRAALFRRYRALVRWLAPLSLLLSAGLLWPFRAVASAPPILAALGICGLAYVFPLIPRAGGWARVKDVPFLKMFVISASWAGGGAGIPLLLGTASVRNPAAPPAPILLVHLALLSLDTFALNYRDRGGDAAAKLTTLAHVAGPRALRWLRLGAWATAALAVATTGSARLVESAMALSFALVTIWIPQLEKREIAYSMAIGGWRFVGYFFAAGCLGQ